MHAVLGLQREAERAAKKIAELKTRQADLVAKMDADRELLASPELQQNHPELSWERAASRGAIPKLGAAQGLLKELRLADFWYAMHLNACAYCIQCTKDNYSPCIYKQTLQVQQPKVCGKIATR